MGRRGGCLGEVCVLVTLRGHIFIMERLYLAPGSSGVYFIFWGFEAGSLALRVSFKGDFIFSILSGGLILGAFFMATDYVTTPLTKKASWSLAWGAADCLCHQKIRGYPEGVSYAILMMNAAVPLIDRWVRPRRYGVKE